MLLGNWPEGHMMTSELLDNSDEVQLIGLLDILQRLESKERFEQVTNTYSQGTYCFVFVRLVVFPYIVPLLTHNKAKLRTNLVPRVSHLNASGSERGLGWGVGGRG